MVLFDASGWTNVRRDRETGRVSSPRMGNAILGELYLRGSRIGTVPTIDMYHNLDLRHIGDTIPRRHTVVVYPLKVDLGCSVAYEYS